MSESVEIAQRLDAIYDTELTNRLVSSLSSSPSYTLADLERLAEQWAIENEATTDARWIVSGLLAWLGRKEREANERETANYSS